jgi:hypothetical protein
MRKTDNYAHAHGTGAAMVKTGYDTWFFLTADYAFGHDLGQYTAAVVKANGGQVQAAGTDETQAVVRTMRATPINDFFVKNGKIREDGRMVHEMYLYEVKKPAESKAAWDFYKLVATMPADQAFLPLSESKCPLVRKAQ